MANLQQIGGNRSRTTGQSSNQNPCKFVELKQSSHTWGLGAPPRSLRLAGQKKKKKKEERERERGVRVRPGRRGRRTRRLRRSGRDSALGLAPRSGGRPSLELHLRAPRHLLGSSWAGAGAGPGPVRRTGTLLTGCRALTPSQRPARRQRRRQGRRLGRRLPRSSAPSRGGGQCCCCGWRRPPPLSPCRTRGLDGAWFSAPAVTAPPFPEVAKRPGESPTRQGRAGEEVRGPPPPAGGGGEQAQPGRGGAPRSSVAHSEVTRRKRRPLTARPSSPRRTHDTSSAKYDGRRRPRRSPGCG